MPKKLDSSVTDEVLEKEELEQRIYNRKRFEENETIVFHMLNQALKEKNISHAYLFSGQAGCLKKEASILFAQSIILNASSLIEEDKLNASDANVARRIASRKYSDFFYLDGDKKEAISKEEVTDIQSLFSKTSSELSDKKVYIIHKAENMSISAMNALLKFLEEPVENVYAILTTDNIDKLLPTVISRCVKIPFHPLKKETYYLEALKEGLDEEDAFLLTSIVQKANGYIDIAVSKAYQNAKSMLKQYIGMQGNARLVLVDYDVQYRLQTKDTDAKEQNIALVKYFLMLLSKFYKDALCHLQSGPDWYKKALENEMRNHTNKTQIKLLEVIENKLNKCNRTNDLNLLLDQAVYEMEEIKYGRSHE